MNSIFLNSIAGQQIEYTPIWLMRQAGRYLPEYRILREKAGSFLNLCQTPELATAVTLQPLKRFNFDAAILFSDILVVPQALGMDLEFIENVGPKFAQKLVNEEDIIKLNVGDIEHNLNYVFTTITHCKAELKVNTPLIGFSGSPFTLACYMLEGGSSTNYLAVKHWLYTKPQAMHQLLSKLTQAIIVYLTAQINAGVDAVMLFDSWGGILTTAAYLEFSLPYLRQIIESLSANKSLKNVPIIQFTKGGGGWLSHIAQIGANVVGIDWSVDIGRAKEALGQNIAVQGNLDPALLAVGDKVALKNEVRRILGSYKDANQGKISGHIFNLGHGVLPMTHPDNVAYLVDLVHEFSS